MLNEHTRINLIDTPGFDDPFLNEAYVLESIAQKLCFDYRQGRYISGMIYLQKITDSLGEGTASLGNLRMFQQLWFPCLPVTRPCDNALGPGWRIWRLPRTGIDQRAPFVGFHGPEHCCSAR